MRKIKLQYLFYFVLIGVLCFFNNKTLSKFKKKILKKFWVNHKIYFNGENFSLHKQSKLSCKKIYFKYSGATIIIINLDSHFNIRELLFFKLSKSIKKLKIESIFNSYNLKIKPKNKNRTYINFKKATSPILKHYKYLKVTELLLSKLLAHKVEINHFVSFIKVSDKIFLFIDLTDFSIDNTLSIQKIELSYNKKIYFTSSVSISHLNKEFQFKTLNTNNTFSILNKNVICTKHYEVNFSLNSKKECHLFTSKIEGLTLNHKAISDKQVFVNSLACYVPIRFTNQEFCILNDSSIEMDGLNSSIEFKHQENDIDLVKVCLNFLIEGETFFANWPFFNIKQLQNINATGDIILRLEYLTLISDFSQYSFEAKTINNTLSVEQSINLNLFDITSSLNCLKEKTTALGIDNKLDFAFDEIKYEKIPPKLVSLIVLTEDPNFYNHNGIDSYFIGNAIAVNLYNKKFIKGASTILMQVVRNIYLFHNKNISRKIDELIIAWLISISFKPRKERILEIYLNIIEFAEGVYGINNASKFYFAKDLHKLTITEILVLTYIIPRPKFFLEAVYQNSSKLNTNLLNHIEFYSKKLYSKGIININDLESIEYKINFAPNIGSLVLNMN